MAPPSPFLLSGASLLFLLHRLPLVTYMQALRSPSQQGNTRHLFVDTNGSRQIEGIPKAKEKRCEDRPPPVWPERLVVVQRRVPDKDSRVEPATTVTYYDSIDNANLIQITYDKTLSALSDNRVLWDLELGNKSSYYFYPDTKKCTTIQFPVGVLRTDWLRDAQPLGENLAWDGARRVCGWTKLDFIDYYADYETGEPTGWYFHTMKASFNVLYYAPGESVRDKAWFIPPEFCAKSAPQEAGSRRDLAWEDEGDGFMEAGDINTEERKLLALMHQIGRS
mmetsp:Transcript_40835/g.75561  ORF Transcript_40835/g.75561 Transcript_40835/m.75561 type:complete len:279 (-) Transcript_40835:428-1264(-)|eukprot:CAMPEP_0197443624 /NCGR_PEP_ID=MMETSP1175-20131217/9319_1 /TAXON_ID=1003142 /ORGANISM="Triceratium dubium, Strain CCMP147" /LENGTH=278 /DNA_ID=CAMNT_0042974287 /DNA_START=134 /DNA_END=970 /DNA_ORIENTATION=-